MTVRLPQPESAARILSEALRERGLALGHAQALDVVARLYGHNSWYAMQRDRSSRESSSAQTLGAGTFRLQGSALKDGCHLKAGNVTITITGNDKSVDVALYPTDQPNIKPLDYVAVDYAEAAKDWKNPDPQRPFHGCALPLAIKGVEIISKHFPFGSHIVQAEHGCGDGYLEWLEKGMPNEDYDLSEAAIKYGEYPGDISGGELIEAELAPDGRFTLKDGRELYLIDELGERWVPRERV